MSAVTPANIILPISIQPRPELPIPKISKIGSFPASPVKFFAPHKYFDLTKEKGNHKVQLGNIEMRKFEKYVLTTQGKCPQDIVANLRVRLFQLDPESMANFAGATGNFDNVYQDSMGCVLDAILANDPGTSLRRWITNINKIGGPSAQSFAFHASYNKDAPLYVIKVTRDDNSDNLPHEAIIGMGALNDLRSLIPTFMHTYGAFMCAPPVLDPTQHVISWCSGRGPAVTYLVLENITNSTPLDQLAYNLNDSEFVQIYLQVLNALNIAYEEYDFTHYDLHAGNVLVQMLPYYVSVPLYRSNGYTQYIKTRYLARIIDYGAAHAYIQGYNFGLYDYEGKGIHSYKAFPITDAYKLLLFTYADSFYEYKDGGRTKNKKISNIEGSANVIYGFFEEGETINERLLERAENPKNDFFQANDVMQLLTLNDLIDFIISKTKPDFIFTKSPPDAIATICENNCITWDAFANLIFTKTKLPATLEDYCRAMEAINAFAGDEKKPEMRVWLQQFDINAVYANESKKFLTLLNLCITDINSINMSPLDSQRYHDTLQKIIDIKQRLDEISLWEKSVICAFSLNDKLASIKDDIEKFTAGVNSVMDYIHKMRKNLNPALTIIGRYDPLRPQIQMLTGIIHAFLSLPKTT